MTQIRNSLITLSAALALPACGVFGLTQEEQDKLNFFQENSALYYDGGRYAQALDLVEQGLQLDPSNYKLLSTQAWCYYRQVEDRPSLLPETALLFQQLYEMRTPSNHGAPALLGQGGVQKTLGIRHWERAKVLKVEAQNEDLPETRRAESFARASEHERQAEVHFERARTAYRALLDNELSMRVAHKQLMDIAATQNDYVAASEHGLACLKYNREEQDIRLRQIRETMEVKQEREARVLYQDLIDQELKVRSALAEMHYNNKDYQASLAQLDEILNIDPLRSEHYYNRANLYEVLGRTEDARRDYASFMNSTNLPSGHEKYVRAYEFTTKR